MITTIECKKMREEGKKLLELADYLSNYFGNYEVIGDIPVVVLFHKYHFELYKNGYEHKDGNDTWGMCQPDNLKISDIDSMLKSHYPKLKSKRKYEQLSLF